jgi:toluene monooxygenase system ferredoxin subunit
VTESRLLTWQVVMPTDDLWEGELTGIRLGAKNIILLNAGGEIRAFEDRCPHLDFQLSQGDLDGCTLTCANHQWEFDALTGRGANPGNCQLTMFGTGCGRVRSRYWRPAPISFTLGFGLPPAL